MSDKETGGGFAPKSQGGGAAHPDAGDKDHAKTLDQEQIDAHADAEELDPKTVTPEPDTTEPTSRVKDPREARNAIAKKHTENRSAASTDNPDGLSDAQLAENAARMEAEAKGEEWTPTNPDGAPEFDIEAQITAQQQEVDGETYDTVSGDDSTDTTQTAGEDDKSAEQDIDGASEQVKIKVYGEDQYATAAEIEEAGGIENLQKNRAADEGLRRNATERRELEARQTRLNEQEARLRAGSDASPAPADLPSGGQGDGADESIKQAVAEIYTGDPEKAAKALQTVISNAIQQDRQQRDPGVTHDETNQADTDGAETQPTGGLGWNEIERTAINSAFHEYPSVVTDENLRPKAIAEVQYRQSLPENAGRALIDIARDAGKYVQNRYIALESADIIDTDEFKERVGKKRRSPARPARTARKPAEEEAPVLTEQQKRSEAVRQTQEARGQSRRQGGSRTVS